MKELKLYKFKKAKCDSYTSLKYNIEQVNRDYLTSEYTKHLLTVSANEYQDHPLYAIQSEFENFCFGSQKFKSFKCPIITTTKIGFRKHIPFIDIDNISKIGLDYDGLLYRFKAFSEINFAIWSSGTQGHYWVFIDKIGSMWHCKKNH